MPKLNETGVYQLPNGYWAFRYAIVVNEKRIDRRRNVDDITVAEINDYMTKLYYVEHRAYGYTESFLKMFYLIFGQAYSRNYLSAEQYDKLCKNKDTKIRMPKMKVEEETDIVTFSDEEIEILSQYFKRTNAETTFMLGKYCGLRISECYGLKWSNIDFERGIIKIDRQMQYQEGVIKWDMHQVMLLKSII